MTSSAIVFDSKAVTIYWNQPDKYLLVEWKGYAASSEYLTVLEKQLDLTREKKAAKIIYDLRKMGVVSAKDQKYTNEVYFPQMAANGSKYAGIIIPDNIFGQVSVQNILGQKNESLFTAKLFNSTSEAVAWIKEVA
jgi:hypothetical protein